MASTPHQSVFSFTNASLSFAPRGAFAEPPAPEGRAILRPYSMTLLTARLKQQLGTTQECLPDPPPTST